MRVKKTGFTTASAMFIYLSMFCCGGSNHVSSRDGFQSVEFSDGSTVFMNRGAEISYPEDFSGNRTVDLKGEAYFVVNKGEVPFIIKTEAGIIEIKGTKLDVKANNDELEVEVDKGEVALEANGKTTMIAGGEKVVIKNKKLIKSKGTKAFRKWLSQLERDIEKLGKKVGDDVEKESKKTEKKLKKLLNR